MKILVAVACLLLFNPVWVSGEEKFSGFLDNYPPMQPDSERPGALIYRKQGLSLASYDKIMIDPIMFWYAIDSPYKGIEPEILKVLSDGFRKTIIKALQPGLPLVSQPRPGTIRVRIAVTDLYVKKVGKRLIPFSTVGIKVRTAERGSLMGRDSDISVKKATVEAELLDAESNERLMVLVDREPFSVPKRMMEIPGEKKASLEETFQVYAKRFRARLIEDRKRKRQR